MSTGLRSRRRVVRAAAVALAGAVAGVTVIVATDGGGAPAPSPVARAAGPAYPAIDADMLPEPVEPAFTPPRPTLLRSRATLSAWAPVRRAVAAHRRPAAASPIVAAIPTVTPEQTDNIVLVVGRARDAAGRVWVKVRIPALPDNVDAWVERSALGGYTAVETRVEVDLQRLTLTLFRAGRRVFRAPVGVGQSRWPTPRGRFYIRNKLTDFASPAYGPIAFGTSARSRVLTDWPAGGFIGIHGTDQPELLPGRVSHGCIRLRNPDIRRLARLMPVGTPVTIA